MNWANLTICSDFVILKTFFKFIETIISPFFPLVSSFKELDSFTLLKTIMNQ